MKPEVLLALRGLKTNKVVSVIIVIALVMGTSNYIIGDAFVNGVEDLMYGTYLELHLGDLTIRPKEKADYIEDIDSKADRIRTIEGVDGVSKRLATFGRVTKGSRGRDVDIVGFVPSDDAKVTNIDKTLFSGSFLRDSDRNKVVLGMHVARDLDVGVGESVEIIYTNGKITKYEVVGVTQAAGYYSWRSVLVNINDLQRDLSVGNVATNILVSLEDRSLAQYTKTLVYQQGISDTIRSAEEEFPGFMRTLKIVTNILRLLVVLGLIIGALMETTLFYVNVISKTRIIAILKAVGTKNSSVMSIYIIQGVIYGIIASSIGIAISYLVTSYLEMHPWFIAEAGRVFTFTFNPYAAIMASGITIFVSILASLYPAYRAAKIDMVEAMRT
ncbi:FtsX-like permease family protein [Candidatus Woesearchaeota archaeon]|nr:FtsX-like permease family protein [Candidatus Woesearchaeota archaeon]